MQWEPNIEIYIYDNGLNLSSNDVFPCDIQKHISFARISNNYKKLRTFPQDDFAVFRQLNY